MNAVVSTSDSPEQYHAYKAVSNSGIAQLLKCPALFKAWSDGALQEETEALLCGSVFHCLALEPESFHDRYHVKIHDGKTAAGKKEKEAAADAGVVMITAKMHAASQAMADAARRHPLVGKLLKAPQAQREVSVYWEEKVDGVSIPCKARIDLLAPLPGFGLVACDLKSTTDAKPETLQKSILKWGYHRQASWYRRALAVAGMPSEVFVLIFVEKTPPHIVTVANVAPAAVMRGHAECEVALATYAECAKANLWPCYTNDILELDLPEWAYNTAI